MQHLHVKRSKVDGNEVGIENYSCDEKEKMARNQKNYGWIQKARRMRKPIKLIALSELRLQKKSIHQNEEKYRASSSPGARKTRNTDWNQVQESNNLVRDGKN